MAAELVEQKENGRDVTAVRRSEFAQQVAAVSEHFAESNRVTSRGWPFGPWSVMREWRTPLLHQVHEVEPLAPDLAPGRHWVGPPPFSLRLDAGAAERVGDEDCLRVEGQGAEGAIHLRYWLCPAAGRVARLEAEADTDLFGGRSHEALRLSLAEVRRGESLEAWLRDPEVREAALAGLDEGDMAPPGALEAVLSTPFDAGAWRRALGLVVRQGGRLDAGLQARLAASTDARVQDMARAPASEPLGPEPSAVGECSSPAEALRRLEAARRLAPERPGTTLRTMTTPGFEGRRYILRIPEDYRPDRPRPLVLVLAGGDGHAIDAALEARDAVSETGALVAYPEAGGMWWEDGPRRAVRALLDELQRRLRVDPDRVTLTGFSNGGTGALDYAMLWPHRLAAAAPLMGAGFKLLAPYGTEPAHAAHLPLLLLHGDKDTVIPSAATVDAAAILKGQKRTAPLEMQILKGRGHDLGLGSDDGRTLAFLLGQRRDPFPRHLVFRPRRAGFDRLYWVRVVEPQGSGEVEATVGDDGVVRVKTRGVRKLELFLRPELFARPGPIRVVVDGREAFRGPLPSDCAALAASYESTADPGLAASLRLSVDAGS